MNEQIENKFYSSIDVKDKDGNLLGAVCVSPSKELGKRDILLMDEKTGTSSARSITELINMLSKRNVSFEDKRRVLEFLAERLRVLEHNIEMDTFKALKEKKSDKET